MTWVEWDQDVQDVARFAAGQIAARYAVDQDDLEQEALVYIATHPATVQRRLQAGGRSYLQWGIESFLAGLAKREHRQRGGRNPAPFVEEVHWPTT